MPQARKLRLGDGSVIELARADLRSWYERGLIGDDTPVQRPGTSRWSRLAEVEDVRGWRGRSGGSARKTAARGARRTMLAGARREASSPWPRRIVLLAAAAVAVAAVAFTSDLWLPLLRRTIAGDAARASAAAALEDAVQRRRRDAVQAAAAELPHLGADVIERVMAGSAAGVLDPPEVFRRSYEAAGRGLASLAPDEAQELGSLNAAMSATLSPRQRAQLADYVERVRGRRPTSPAEDAEMSRLVRRGTSSLAPPRRARLQALFSKAVASALSAAPPSAQLPGGAVVPGATR